MGFPADTRLVAEHPAASRHSGVLWVRRCSPYAVSIIALWLGAGGLLRVVQHLTTDDAVYGMGALFVGILLLVLAHGLFERNPHSWTILHGAGAATLAAVGIVALLLFTGDGILWVERGGQADTALPALLFGGGVLLLAWALLIMADRGSAAFSWQIALQPLAVVTVGWWLRLLWLAAARHQALPIILSVLWIGAGIGILVSMTRGAARHQRQHRRTGGPAMVIPTTFPTRYHELLARGRFCDIFELPCSHPCPLPVIVAARYQKRRVQHQMTPELMEPFEKAYTILITPQLRELCQVTHEMMQTLEKQWGPKRYQELEIRLWTHLWKRVQDGEFKGDPAKVRQEKPRLIREMTLLDD